METQIFHHAKIKSSTIILYWIIVWCVKWAIGGMWTNNIGGGGGGVFIF
jgi:hypothetical protein